MTIERLREVLRTTPFRRFLLHMSDGGNVEVSHPEALASNPTGPTIVVFAPDDRMHIIDLLLVSRVEILSGAAPRKHRGSNGR